MNKTRKNPLILGRSGEDIALRYLKKAGYRILHTNFRLFRGEIDIIARDGQTLVFIEVKSRKSKDFGSPEESVTFRKQHQIKKIARGFLAKTKCLESPCRFDVFSVLFHDDMTHEIQHIRDAF